MVFAITLVFPTPSTKGLLERQGIRSVPHSHRSGGRMGT